MTPNIILTIDLEAIQSNYRLLKNKLSSSTGCAAVVKANAYGLGLEQVVKALEKVGCSSFFVASLEEAILLRKTLPAVSVAVFGEQVSDSIAACLAHRITPVLNDKQDMDAWRLIGKPAILHVDTGMTRLGVSEKDIEHCNGLSLSYIMSHLACAEKRDHSLNHIQLEQFQKIRNFFPDTPASFANSSGIFLGKAWHFDLVRPGYALYGGNPTPGQKNPMKPVIHLQAKILQIHAVDTPQTVGYGALRTISGKVATVGIGYEDGLFRTLGNTGHLYVQNYKTPIVGTVSMDLTTIDVSAVPDSVLQHTKYVDIINTKQTIDDLARDAGTIGYDILTSLGKRCDRRYQSLS